MDRKGCPKCLMAGSLLAVVLAAVGWLGSDVWLASTQWLLVAVVLGVYALWFKVDK